MKKATGLNVPLSVKFPVSPREEACEVPSVPDSRSSTCSNTQALSNKGFWETGCGLGLPRYPLFFFFFFNVPFTEKEGSGEKVELRAQPQSPRSLQYSHIPKDAHILGRLTLVAGSPKCAYGCCQTLHNMAEYILFVDILAFSYSISDC